MNIVMNCFRLLNFNSCIFEMFKVEKCLKMSKKYQNLIEPRLSSISPEDRMFIVLNTVLFPMVSWFLLIKV